MKIKRIAILAAAAALALAACQTPTPSAGVVTKIEWRVNLVRAGSPRIVETFTALTQENAWSACVARLTSLTPATYECKDLRFNAVVSEEPPPTPSTCDSPQPADETRTVECPTGTTGSWEQSRTYVAAAYPTCWTASAWQPTSAPAGACTSDPPPAGDAIIVNPGESISAGIQKLQPGGTVIVKPGTYAPFSLKACTAAAWCTVKAETDGTVIVTGLNVATGNWYTKIEGLKFKSSTGKKILGSYLKFMRVAFEGGPPSGNEVSLGIGTSEASAKNVLVEDSWVYGGGGRYKVLVYNAENIVLRRVTVRHDGGWTYNQRDPQGGFSLYDSRNVACQNCMFVDSVQSLAGFEAGLYLVSNGTAIRQANILVNGAVILDSPNNGVAAEGNSSATTYDMADIAVSGSKQGALNTNNSGHTINASRVYCNVKGTCFGKWASGGAIRVTDCKIDGGKASDGASLTRCPGGASANLVKRIGVSGSLFGEAGFDAVQEQDLWPWPYEDRIKADFDSVRPAFGGKTLTEYVESKIN